jgi:uncharacterized membrane protein
MEALLGKALFLWSRHCGWIIWNLFLAFIPLGLSFWLFRRRHIERTLGWWLAFLVYFAFLPNAPYLLTDIIHLISVVRWGYSIWTILFFFMPLHLFAIWAGFQAYVVAVINQEAYLHRQGLSKRTLFGLLMATHLLNAIGVFLGRFNRLNSWEFVSDPGDVLMSSVDVLTSRMPLLVIFASFIILAVLYWIFKQLTYGVILRVRQARAGKEELW